jgi:ATP-binding cassette subfamily F protein 3
LINALSEYNGTLLFVSHNQSFIKRLATKIWDIRGGEIVEYPGNLTEYFYHIAGTEDESANDSSQGETHEERGGNKALVRKGQDRKKEKREKAEKRQLIYNTLKPLLTDIFSDKNRGVPLLSEYKALREEQDELLLKWEQSQDKLETTRKELGVGDR